jgi:RNA polymerase sigma factor (sigma-70 family)
MENLGTDDIRGNRFCIEESHTDKINDRLLILEAMKKLTPLLKNVVVLYYFNDMTVREISKILGYFQGTVKSRLHKARKQSGKELNSDFGSDLYPIGKELKLNEK